MAEPQKGVVLVVDDNATNRELARATLEDEGYDVVLADGGAEALARFAETRIDCVLLDIRMPGLDGFAVCARLRELPRGKEVPVLFFTAVRDVETFDRAMLAGGDDFLTKPVLPTELVVRVQTAVALGQAKAEARELYDLVKKQRDDLLRLQLQKERLTTFLVHDLKNPVNAMDLHAQLLVRDRALPAGAREAAGAIRAEAKQLTRMIGNLLDISRADEGALRPQRSEVELSGVVREVFGELETAAGERGVTLRLVAGSLVKVAVDVDLLRRVVINLVENALRYAPERTTVTVAIVASPEGLELRVSDEGRGIPEEMREHVFDAFAQLPGGESRTSRGLGLSFCRAAVEAHGGTIRVEPGAVGATFHVHLPLHGLHR